MPAPPILVLEKHEIAGLVESGLASRIVQEHEGEETGRFRRRRWPHQHPHEAPEADGLGAEVGPHERLAPGGRIPLVEDEIDDRQHRVDPRGHVLRVGHRVRDARVADLGLRADEALRHGRGRHEKRARDLVRLEAAQRAKRERDLRLGGQRRVAAGEDQPEAIIGDLGRIVVGLLGGRAQLRRGIRFQLVREPRPAPDAIDALVPGRLDDPGPRRLGNAGGPPLVHRGHKGFLGGLFGQVEIADEANEGGDDPAPIGAVDRVDSLVGIQGRRHEKQSTARVEPAARRSTH